MASGGRLKTFGEKPKSFTLEENGEAYYIGSEVYSTKLIYLFDNVSTNIAPYFYAFGRFVQILCFDFAGCEKKMTRIKIFF